MVIKAGRLHAIPAEDVNYLESQGCLHIPTQPSLDVLVQHYFLHVHVVLPLLNEGDFWEMYYQSNKPGGSREKMSLLVFQAMLYASCHFISLETIKALGFPNIRTAKATFYRRVKLLYDMETEDSQLSLAQAALLLTCWVPGSKSAFQLKPNSTWLSLAIQHARSINADRCTTSTPTTSTAGTTVSSQPQKLQNMLRRLWWSCIIRDRLGSLCTRRSINITRDRFGFDAVTPLGFADLEDEVHRSSVYNAATKRSLARLLTHYIQFCIVLTDVLTLVFPFENAQQSRITPRPEDEAKIEECKLLLERWHERTSIYFPVFGGTMGNHSLNEDKAPHKSVILNTNNLSARIALYHYSILYRSTTLDDAAEPSRHKTLEIIHENRQELQDAALGVTECLGELVRRHLVHWLPITAVACVATPLALHSITAKLASARCANTTISGGAAGPLTPAAGGATAANSSTNQKRMTVFNEAMKAFLPRYEGTDWVAETVRHVSSLAQSLITESAGSGAADWTDLLARHTSSYLLMTMTIDVCISQGRLPEERDFPAWLRGRTGPVRGALEGGGGAAAAAAAHPVGESAAAEPSVGAMSPMTTTTTVVGQAAMMGGPGQGFDLGSTGAMDGTYGSFAFQPPPQQRPETDDIQREPFGGAAAQTFDSFLQESSVMEDWEGVFLQAMNGLNYPNV
ncbi:hypothetical protein SLS63_013982 [Diaporthe eres]|uniref:Xylanolytic transcriptional activator regulatory domain-containing protein n=1 Tax=Diaporthe eres TaxID=83184 RepID=A0ABR1NM00_DIAER